MNKKYLILLVVMLMVLPVSTVMTRTDDQSSALQTVQSLTSFISNHIISDTQVRKVASTDKKTFLKYKEENRKYHTDIQKYMDFDRLGTLSMPKKWQKKYWQNNSTKQQYLSLFQELIEEIVYPRGKDFFKEVKLSYKGAVALDGPNNVSIICDAAIKEKEGKSVQIEYRLIQKNGTWKVYDVNLEGDWWSESFKSQFNHIITKKSYPELISKMQLKLKNVKQGLSF